MSEKDWFVFGAIGVLYVWQFIHSWFISTIAKQVWELIIKQNEGS